MLISIYAQRFGVVGSDGWCTWACFWHEYRCSFVQETSFSLTPFLTPRSTMACFGRLKARWALGYCTDWWFFSLGFVMGGARSIICKPNLRWNFAGRIVMWNLVLFAYLISGMIQNICFGCAVGCEGRPWRGCFDWSQCLCWGRWWRRECWWRSCESCGHCWHVQTAGN